MSTFVYLLFISFATGARERSCACAVSHYSSVSFGCRMLANHRHQFRFSMCFYRFNIAYLLSVSQAQFFFSGGGCCSAVSFCHFSRSLKISCGYEISYVSFTLSARGQVSCEVLYVLPYFFLLIFVLSSPKQCVYSSFSWTYLPMLFSVCRRRRRRRRSFVVIFACSKVCAVGIDAYQIYTILGYL